LDNWDTLLSILQWVETILATDKNRERLQIDKPVLSLCSFLFFGSRYELKFEHVFSAVWFVKLIEFYIAWSLSFFIWWYLLNSFLFLKFHHPFWDYIFVIYSCVSGEVISEHMISSGCLSSSFVIFICCVLILFWLIISVPGVWFVCWFQFWSLFLF
jgi:hypothetical protein